MSEPRRAAVLVVDDRPEQRLSLGALLEELGEEVITAASGEEALRWLLRRDFAVILLDVNMPGMDGFDTAALIRQRRSSQYTPIIFVTADADDTHVERGYSLGAVDYILSPVNPDVLRTKVSVFLDLYRKTQELTRHADALRRNASQLRCLADASIAVHAASSIDELLKRVAETAASIVGAHQAAIEVDAPRLSAQSRHAVWWPERSALDALGSRALARMPARPVRLSRQQLEGSLHGSGAPDGAELMPLRGWLAVPLSGRDAQPMGWIQLSEKEVGDFTAEDESLVVQLAQMTSIAVENLLLNDAQEANRLKDQFLAILSHELRTPLQAMLSWSRILREPGVDHEMLPRGLEVIERNARAQTRLIEDLLDVSRIISGKLVIDKRPLCVAELVRQALEDAQPAAREKQVELRVEQAADPWIHGDATRLRQVLGNLISNGIKFTPAGGSITLGVDLEGDHARVCVRDTGNGISPDFLPHLFERFRQADSSPTRSASGLGIGLAIVKHLVDLHGGTIRAESDGVGCGTNVVLRFPLAGPGAAAVERDSARPPVRLERALVDVHVLLVDDETDSRDCLAIALKRGGAEVVAVGSAAEALAVLDTVRVDVLLSDLAMPGQDGLWLIRALRERPSDRGGQIAAAALSAYARAEDRARAILAGFDDLMAQPRARAVAGVGARGAPPAPTAPATA
jgi:signal transduction histidine kinase